MEENNEIEIWVKTKIIKDLQRGIDECKKDYRPRTNMVRKRMVIFFYIGVIWVTVLDISLADSFDVLVSDSAISESLFLSWPAK
jgi:hypothetical protein